MAEPFKDRNEARAELERCQMNYPTDDQLSLLLACLIRRLIMWQGLRDTLRAGKVLRKRRQVTCKAHYFKSREAFTFSPDGFVGIAGWADDTTVTPFLGALQDWIKEVAGD